MRTRNHAVKLLWTKYSSFFDLYEKKGAVRKLIYVIGSKRLVYVGCVGARNGKGGLRRRYDKPYVERAKSIFGRHTPSQQPAYAAEFVSPAQPSSAKILNAERMVQNAFQQANREGLCMFKVRGRTTKMKIMNCGTFPEFLKKVIEA